MKPPAPSTANPPPTPRLAQAVLLFDDPRRKERIPEANRTKCLLLLRELLEVVVLQKGTNRGGNDER
jgi:hypothetical protein